MSAQRFYRPGPLAIRPSAMFELFASVAVPRVNAELADGAVQVVNVSGPLVQSVDAGWCDDYESIRARVRDALAGTARAVVLKINSPGGTLYGALDTARAIRADADAAGKPLVAFVDGDGCSAAYAIACAADSIVLGASSVVGSIGVIKAREDASLALAARGVSVTYVASGSRKAYGRPELGMTEAELADTQALVDQLAAPFLAYVAERRGLPVEVVAGYEAGEFTGPAALQARLADRLMSLDAIVASLATPNSEVSAMKMDEIVAALQAAAKSDDPKEQAAAVKMLAAMTAEEKPESEGDTPEPDAEDDEEKPAAEVEVEIEEEDDKAKPPGAKSAKGTVSAATASKIATDLAEAHKRIAALEHAHERSAIDGLLKGQPKALREALRDKPLADVRAIIGALPKAGRPPVVTTLSTPQGTPAAPAPPSAEDKRKAAEAQIDPRIMERIERQTRHGAVKKTAARMIGGSLYFDVPENYDPAKYGLGVEPPKN
jgi:capsid assembly protease